MRSHVSQLVSFTLDIKGPEGCKKQWLLCQPQPGMRLCFVCSQSSSKISDLEGRLHDERCRNEELERDVEDYRRCVLVLHVSWLYSAHCAPQTCKRIGVKESWVCISCKHYSCIDFQCLLDAVCIAVSYCQKPKMYKLASRSC